MATTTPNIGLQIPGFNQANWQVPLNFDLNLLDLIFGGAVQIPALSVASLTVTNFTLPNFLSLLQAAFVVEEPVGAFPGTVYTCSAVLFMVLGVYFNGAWQRPGIDYTVTANVMTLAFSTDVGDNLWVAYFTSSGSVAPPPPSPPLAIAPVVLNVAGTVNGINTAFSFVTSAATPSISLFAGGVFMTPTTDYSLTYAGSSTWTVTFVSAPTSGPITALWYQ